MNIYRFDGKNLSSIEKPFEEWDRGIFGLFSVESHPADPDTFVFYDCGKDVKEFHHPTKTGFEYKNWGFQEFLKEELNSGKNVSGGVEGSYGVNRLRELSLNWVVYSTRYRVNLPEGLGALIEKGYVSSIKDW